MKLEPLDRDVAKPKNVRYLVPRRRLLPVRAGGKVRYLLRKAPLALPRWLNWLGRWLAGR